MTTTITEIEAFDIRFPTSEGGHGRFLALTYKRVATQMGGP